MKSKFNIIPLASDFSKEQIPSYIEKYSKYLKNIGGIFTEELNLNKELPIFYFVISGGTERQLLDIVSSQSSSKKVYLIAHPDNNSLPASFEIVAKLKQDNISSKLFFLDDCSLEQSIDSIYNEIRNIEVNKKLHNSKIGLIGKPSDWLIASSPDAETIKKNWGANIINISLNEIFDKYKNLNLTKDDNAHLNQFKNKSSEIIEPLEDEIKDTYKIYKIIKSIAENNKLDALTVRCFDIVLRLKTTGCYAMAQLTDEGIISGCEGDLVSTIAMLWSYYITDNIPWMANPSNFSLEKNTLNIAHCTVPMNLLKNYTIRSHFESSIGVAIEGKMPKDDITLLRIGGKKLDKLWIGEGKVIENTNCSNYCRTQIKIKFDDNTALEQLVTNPLGNHLVMIYGRHKEKLKNYFDNYINNIQSTIN